MWLNEQFCMTMRAVLLDTHNLYIHAHFAFLSTIMEMRKVFLPLGRQKGGDIWKDKGDREGERAYNSINASSWKLFNVIEIIPCEHICTKIGNLFRNLRKLGLVKLLLLLVSVWQNNVILNELSNFANGNLRILDLLKYDVCLMMVA